MKLLSTMEYKLLTLLVACAEGGRELAKTYRLVEGKRIPYGTLYTVLRRLRKRRLVRTLPEADGRAKLFMATEAGEQAYRSTRAHYYNMAEFGKERHV